MGNIGHYASFPPTGVSLRQMVQFGEKPSVGKYLDGYSMVTLTKARHPLSSVAISL